MKTNAHIWLKRISILVIATCLLLSPLETMVTQAAAFRAYDSKKDIDYTNGKGKDVVLTHYDGENKTAKYELSDSRLTRNATYYMSMQVKFTRSHSWFIRLRNASCKIKGETVTGNMQFHLFKNNGTLEVGGETVGATSWTSFKDIQDNAWHTLGVRSTPDTFELWVDGERAVALYLNEDVTDLTSNYVKPVIQMAGYNDGTIKNICIWNNGTTENPVMPADKVVQAIESLPDTISLKTSEVNQVEKVRTSYEALSASEKAYVTNYDKLEQLLKSSGSAGKNAYIEVSGTKTGTFRELFPDGVISHKKDKSEKLFFETSIGRTATYYIQFVLNMSKEDNCFDVVLRNQQHEIDGKSVTGNVTLRLFKRSAVVLDSRQNEVSKWVNYPINLFEGSHTVTVESTPTSCTLWIDEVQYKVPEYLSKISGKPDCIQAVTGFMFSRDCAEGTISNIRVWSNQNTYAAGDQVRADIFALPKLSQLSLSDADQVRSIRKKVDSLGKNQKKYVTNLEKLESTERAIAYLEKKGEDGYRFLKDEMPTVEKDYVNLISTGKLNIPAEYRNKVDYDAAQYMITYKDPKEYVNASYSDIQGIGTDDTYLIKFTYAPHELYYETESAAWMGLRVTFSGYSVGALGARTRNKTQFAFMTNQCALLSWANSNAAPTEYLNTFAPKEGNVYQVTMLCEQGRMKIWVDGEPIAYYDELPEYPFQLEFESSRARCDVKNIQLYNLTNPRNPELKAASQESFKMIGDTLYDVKGISDKDRVEMKKKDFIVSLTLLIIVIVLSVVIIVFSMKKKQGILKSARKETLNNEKEENS